MQEKVLINPKYVPIFLTDDSKRRNGNKRRTCVLGVTATLCVIAFIGVYIFTIASTPNYTSCYRSGCYGSHRAELYGKVPEDNITIPRIKTRPIEEGDGFKLVCYYNFPSDENSDELQVNDLDPRLCTHLNVGFATVENGSVFLPDEKTRTIRRVIRLKDVNRDLKVLLSVGGNGAGGFGSMVRNHTTRKTFIQSILTYVKLYKIDGIDLDWEFPNEVGTATKERMHFTQLLHEIRKEINRQRKHRFLLTVAVAAPYFVAMNAYDIDYIANYVDFVNVMTYDFHVYSRLTPFTGINSPLYSLPHDVGIFGTLNVNYSANFWLSEGMPRSKVVIGLPTYGHTYRLINERNNGISAPAIGFGDVGNNGFLDYSETCRFMDANGAVPFFDEVSKSPYVTHSHEWISFDDTKSLTYKAEFIKNNNFGGAMIYCLNSDDYRNLCNAPFYGNRTKFPLVQAVRDVLINPQY